MNIKVTKILIIVRTCAMTLRHSEKRRSILTDIEIHKRKNHAHEILKMQVQHHDPIVHADIGVLFDFCGNKKLINGCVMCKNNTYDIDFSKTIL